MGESLGIICQGLQVTPPNSPFPTLFAHAEHAQRLSFLRCAQYGVTKSAL